MRRTSSAPVYPEAPRIAIFLHDVIAIPFNVTDDVRQSLQARNLLIFNVWEVFLKNLLRITPLQTNYNLIKWITALET